MEIQHLAEDFYVLQALGATAHVEPFRHSHQRWWRDYQEYTQTFNRKFARALYDYLCLIVFGEARHASELASHHYPDWPVNRDNSRGAAYSLAIDYSPENFLPKAIKLFWGAKWHSDYGGESWAAIAEAALMYGKVPDVVFIDHTLDLSHNSGLCFDKIEAHIFGCQSKHDYREFLDMKARANPEEFIFTLRCSYYAARLVKRAYNLGIVYFLPPRVDVEHTDEVYNLLNRLPIRWGSCTIDSDMELSEVECDGCRKTIWQKDAIDTEDGTFCQNCYYENKEDEDEEEEEEDGYNKTGYTYSGDYTAATREDGRGSASAA